MEYHRVNKNTSPVPEIGEIVLIVGEEKNKGRWMKGKVVKHVKEKDGVVRGVIILHEGNYLTVLHKGNDSTSMSIRNKKCGKGSNFHKENYNVSTKENVGELAKRPERRAAKIAKENTKEQLQDE